MHIGDHFFFAQLRRRVIGRQFSGEFVDEVILVSLPETGKHGFLGRRINRRRFFE